MTGKESDDTREQARQAFENLKNLLTAAGATLQYVVKVTSYLHDLKYPLPFHDVWMEGFPKTRRRPSRFKLRTPTLSPDGMRILPWM